MKEFENIIQINPGYPDCSNCYIVEDLIKKPEKYHIFSKPNTHNLQIDKGVLRIICHKNIIGGFQMSIIKTFPRIGQKKDDKNFVESSRNNLARICPALNHPKESPIDAKDKKPADTSSNRFFLHRKV